MASGVGYDSESFPGLYCPGLIEARVFHHAPPVMGVFPGLYCPGLIEARPGGASRLW